MKVTTGVDIQTIEEVKKRINKDNNYLEGLVFTRMEIDYCLSKAHPEQHFAGKFCAKEAVVKALSKFMKVGVGQLEILNDEGGRPFVKAIDFKIQGFVDISISHSGDYAVGFAVYYDGI